jgi:hypothetical protein
VRPQRLRIDAAPARQEGRDAGEIRRQCPLAAGREEERAPAPSREGDAGARTSHERRPVTQRAGQAVRSRAAGGPRLVAIEAALGQVFAREAHEVRGLRSRAADDEALEARQGGRGDLAGLGCR